MTSTKKIAVLGMGAMGGRVAARLLKMGSEVVVWNRSPGPTGVLAAAGARVADSPKDAVAGAEVVIAMLTDDEVSGAVWRGESGALAGLAPGALAVESSTLSPKWARELGGEVSQMGARFVNAPVVGTRPQADAGELLYLAGGAPDDIAELAAAVEPAAKGVRHVGPIGAGMAVKLAVNAMFATQLAALAELLAMTEHQGLDPAEVFALLEPTPVMSPIAAAMGKMMLAGKFDPLFPIALVEKDLRYAAGAGAKTPIASALAEVYAEARDAGFGGDNITGIAQLYR